MNYKSMIDKLLTQIEQETTSAHELTTKLCNIEYYSGQLYMIYSIAESALTPEDFIQLYDYRRADRDRLSTKANRDIINKVYHIVRAA